MKNSAVVFAGKDIKNQKSVHVFIGEKKGGKKNAIGEKQMPKYNPPWSEAEEKYLKRMCDDYWPFSKMAEVLKSRTENGIAKHAKSKGWSNIRPIEIDEKKFKEIMCGSKRM